MTWAGKLRGQIRSTLINIFDKASWWDRRRVWPSGEESLVSLQIVTGWGIKAGLPMGPTQRNTQAFQNGERMVEEYFLDFHGFPWISMDFQV